MLNQRSIVPLWWWFHTFLFSFYVGKNQLTWKECFLWMHPTRMINWIMTRFYTTPNQKKLSTLLRMKIPMFQILVRYYLWVTTTVCLTDEILLCELIAFLCKLFSIKALDNVVVLFALLTWSFINMSYLGTLSLSLMLLVLGGILNLKLQNECK